MMQSEVRNPKPEVRRMSEARNPKPGFEWLVGFNLWTSDFGFVSNVGFRTSDFPDPP